MEWSCPLSVVVLQMAGPLALDIGGPCFLALQARLGKRLGRWAVGGHPTLRRERLGRVI